MPSPLSRKNKNKNWKRINRQRNLKPALTALNSLVSELENSENPKDEETTSERQKRKSSTAKEEQPTRNKTVSPDSFFRRNGFFSEGFGSDSERDDSEEESFTERSKVRALTEIERLEEAQTVLEDRVKHVRALLQRRDRTRNQRVQGQRTLERLEAKLDMLDQRLEYERAGKSRWTFVRRVLRKPKVGFHSSELLNRKVPLGLLAASVDAEDDGLDGVGALAEQDSNSEGLRLNHDQPPPEPKNMFKTKELQDFHVSLEEKVVDESSKDDGKEKADFSEREDNAWLMDGRTDRREMDKGWLRISDRPKNFIRNTDISKTHQSKEAWVNINERGHQIFARKVLRSHMSGRSSMLSRSFDERNPRTSDVRQNGTFNSSDRGASNNLSQTCSYAKDKNIEEHRPGRISSSRPQTSQSLSPSTRPRCGSSRSQRAQVVKIDSIVGTTSFLPPIPKCEAKKRPKQEQVEKLRDENDEEQKKERFILLPNRKRVAKRRAEMYLRQLEFVKSHGLDQKEVLKNMGSLIEEHLAGEEEASNHEAKTTPRNTLFLIGALSRDRLYTPTTPSEH